MQLKSFFSKLIDDDLTALQFFQLAKFFSLLAVSVLLVKTGYSKEDVANYEFMLWLSGAVSFFWVNALVQVFLSHQPKWSLDSQSKNLKSVFLVFQVLAVISAFVAFMAYRNLTVSLFILFQTPANINEYFFFSQKKNKHLLAYSLFTLASIVLLVAILSFYNFEIEYILNALVIGAFLRWSVTFFISLSFLNYKTSLPPKEFLFAFGLLCISFVFSGSAEFINGWLVKFFADESAFAEFRLGSKEIPIFTILAATLSNSFISKISADSDLGLSQLKDKSKRYMHLLFPLSILFVLASTFIYNQFLSSAYESSSDLFAILMLLTIPRLVFPQTIMHALNQQKIITTVSAIELILHVTFAIFLFHILGLKGIVLAIVLANFLEKLLLIAYLKLNFGISPSKYVPFPIYFTYSTLLILILILKLMY